MKKITLTLALLFLSPGCTELQVSPATPNISPEEIGTQEPPVARVNGQPVWRDTLQQALWKSYGRQLLDELVQLEMVRQRAEQDGIIATDQHLSQELNRLLEDMAPHQSRSRQLELLKYMLKSRGMARGQLDLILERQALLRQMVDQQVKITDEQINQQYQRTFGRKVTVRQLLVSSLRRMEEAKRLLSEAEKFEDVVAQFSEDQTSLADAGLVGPFSRVDPDIPIAIRQAAFTLEHVGQLSPVVEFRNAQNNPWWALLRLEELIPPDTRGLPEVRDQLIRDIRRQTIANRIAALQQTIQDEARVIILDPQFQPLNLP